ncbi:hypothetical protein BC834DRAFT_994697, partial [Gloeopeniophorella convolvens]
TSILQGCADTCAAQELDFAALLHEPLIEGRPPVYWAVLKRAVVPKRDGVAPVDPDAVVLALLDAARPLRADGVAEARRACMTVSDNALFQRLRRRYAEFAPLSNVDTMLLDGSDAEDSVEVEEVRGDAGAFAARIKVAQFQLRMRVSKRVRIEFVARERLWGLTFSADNPDATGVNRAWMITLDLGKHSPPTWVDAQLVVTNPSSAATGSREKRPTSIPLKCQNGELQHESSDGMDDIRGRQLQHTIAIELDNSIMGVHLQNEYVWPMHSMVQNVPFTTI